MSGIQYLYEEDLVYERISCDGIFLSQDGQVKIGNVECCKRRGDFRLLTESFSRIVMDLMDKTRLNDDAVGLSQPQQWSVDAVDFFSLCSMQPTTLSELFDHTFLEKREGSQLKLLVFLILISGHHKRV